MAFYINNSAFINAGDITASGEITAAQGTFANLSAGNITLAGNQTAPEYTATVSVQTPIIKSTNDMFIQTNGTTRLTIQDTGIALDNTSSKVLALSDVGTDIVYKTDIIDLDTAQVLTNKTLNSTANTIQVSGTNIDSLVNQDVRLLSNPSFLSVAATTINAGNFVKTNIIDTFDFITPSPLSLYTGGNPRLVIPNAGIPLDGTITNVLGLQGTTLSYSTSFIKSGGSAAFASCAVSGSLSGGVISTPGTLNVGSLSTLADVVATSVGTTGGISATTKITTPIVDSLSSLKLQTNAVDRVVIPSNGIPVVGGLTSILGLQGTTLSTTTSPIFNSISSTGDATIGGTLQVSGTLTGVGIITSDSNYATLASWNNANGVNLTIFATATMENATINNVLKPKFIDTNDGLGASPLTFRTGGVERLVIPNSGIPINNGATNLLSKQGTTLSYTTNPKLTSLITDEITQIPDSPITVNLYGTSVLSFVNQGSAKIGLTGFQENTLSTAVNDITLDSFGHIGITPRSRWTSNSGNMSQTVFNGAFTLITILSEDIVSVGGITYNTGTGVFTIPQEGLYTITTTGIANWAGAGGVRILIADIDPGPYQVNLSRRTAANIAGQQYSDLTASYTKAMPAGSTFSLSFYQDSGSNRTIGNVGTPSFRIEISITRLY